RPAPMALGPAIREIGYLRRRWRPAGDAQARWLVVGGPRRHRDRADFIGWRHERSHFPPIGALCRAPLLAELGAGHALAVVEMPGDLPEELDLGPMIRTLPRCWRPSAWPGLPGHRRRLSTKTGPSGSGTTGYYSYPKVPRFFAVFHSDLLVLANPTELM